MYSIRMPEVYDPPIYYNIKKTYIIMCSVPLFLLIYLLLDKFLDGNLPAVLGIYVHLLSMISCGSFRYDAQVYCIIIHVWHIYVARNSCTYITVITDVCWLLLRTTVVTRRRSRLRRRHNVPPPQPIMMPLSIKKRAPYGLPVVLYNPLLQCTLPPPLTIIVFTWPVMRFYLIAHRGRA